MWEKEYLRKFNLAVAYKDRREKKTGATETSATIIVYQVHTCNDVDSRNEENNQWNFQGGRETSETVDMNGVENMKKQKKRLKS